MSVKVELEFDSIKEAGEFLVHVRQAHVSAIHLINQLDMAGPPEAPYRKVLVNVTRITGALLRALDKPPRND